MNLIEKGYKMLVCDFDLSLSKTDRTVSERTVRAIKDFQAKGGIFGVCTGRALPSLDLIYSDYGLTGFKIAYHGSIVSDEKGNVISDTCMSYKEACELWDLLNPDGSYFTIVYAGDKIYCNIDDEKRVYYMKMTRVEVIYEPNLREKIEKEKMGVRKILLIGEPELMKSVMNRAESKISPSVQASISSPMFIEAVHVDSTKGSAVLKLARAMNVRPEDIVTVGDSSIDVSMLKCVGCGIAVKNADEETKKSAKYIADYTCDEDAVYHIIEECAFSPNPDYKE